MIDGRPYRGASGAAAELGHTIVAADLDSGAPEPKRFPQPGSLESFAAGRALDRLAAEAADRYPDSALGRLRSAGTTVDGHHAVDAARDGGSVLSRESLEAAFRLARAQDATLMPSYLAVVPPALALEAPLGGECEGALALLELIEQRAKRAGVAVDSRIERGRSAKHGLERLMAEERFDSVVIPARTSSSDGFSPDDVAWVLENAPGEVIVLRPRRTEVE